jgi:hypothetical protein
MRTVLSQSQITAILDKHFDGINFAMYDVQPDGTFGGVLIDHPYQTDIPDDEQFK